MASKSVHIQDLTGRRRGWTPIGVVVDSQGVFALPLLELARERRWQLVSLGKFGGHLWSDLGLKGALVDRLPDNAAVRELLDAGVPTVRIGSWPNPADTRVPAVMTDRVAYGVLAAEHFAQRDFRNVGCVGFDPWGDNEPTYEAFKRRADELGMTCHLLRHKTHLSSGFEEDRIKWESRQKEFADWIEQQAQPIGLLTFGDAAADRCCHWARAAGLRVPEDVAILGTGNDVFLCESAKIPLSSIAEDAQHVAATAVDLLARIIAGEKPQQTTVKIPPAGIVMRQSTDVLAASDPCVVKALRYMWNHIADDLSVDQIAEHVGVSRRTLERSFQKCLGRGINTEFQRRRLDRACHLLAHTELRIGAVSEALGFSSQKYFCEAFRVVYNISPTQFRAHRRNTTPPAPARQTVA